MMKAYLGLEGFDFDSFFNCYQSKLELKQKNGQSKEVLERKCSFFIHNLISRQISSHDDTAYLNAGVLKEVFGNEYKMILDYLIESDIVEVVSPYVNGVTSKGYRIVDLDEKIIHSTKSRLYPCRAYVNSLEGELRKQEKIAKKAAQKNLTKPFYNNYQNSLNKLRINIEKAQEYIDIHFREKDKKSRHYHLNILEKYQEKQYCIKVPNEIDNRIYHLLTSTPRELKNFLNIKFQVDIRNSHPLLLNALIFERYEIRQFFDSIRQNHYLLLNTEINTEINKKIRNGKYSKYNDGKYLCNVLKDKELEAYEIEKIEKIPFDVLKYIYLTSTGGFWDKILADMNEEIGGYRLTRQDVKVILFGQVFYGKSLRIPTAYKYARLFKEEFPNVYALILSYKEGLEKEERTVLAHKLMALESELFREALRRLFEMNFEVVSIHDAIVVLDTPANANCSVELVENVLKEVYMEKGLACECSVDFYGKKAMKDFLESERKLRQMGDEYISNLREESKKDKSKEGLLKDYMEGKSEIIWDKEKGSVILHLKKIDELLYNTELYPQKRNTCFSLKKTSFKGFHHKTHKSRLERLEWA